MGTTESRYHVKEAKKSKQIPIHPRVSTPSRATPQREENLSRWKMPKSEERLLDPRLQRQKTISPVTAKDNDYVEMGGDARMNVREEELDYIFLQPEREKKNIFEEPYGINLFDDEDDDDVFPPPHCPSIGAFEYKISYCNRFSLAKTPPPLPKRKPKLMKRIKKICSRRRKRSEDGTPEFQWRSSRDLDWTFEVSPRASSLPTEKGAVMSRRSTVCVNPVVDRIGDGYIRMHRNQGRSY